MKMAKLRGSNMQNHQKPYSDDNLTDPPVGADPYRGPGNMDSLDMDTIARAENNTTGVRPQSSYSRMAKRDNNDKW
jgi:hypothetical protein